jgi:hypothetical protein
MTHQEPWEDRFDRQFDGYWRGRAIPDEIKFFIRKEISTALEAKTVEVDAVIDALIEKYDTRGVADSYRHSVLLELKDTLIRKP